MSRLKALSTAESTYVCICKELNAERRVVGGTAVFQGLLEPINRTRASRQRLHAHASVYGGGETYW